LDWDLEFKNSNQQKLFKVLSASHKSFIKKSYINDSKTGFKNFLLVRLQSLMDNHDDFGLEMGPCEKFFNLLRVNKNLIRPGQKMLGSKTGWPLIYCGSKVCLGQASPFLF